MGIGENIIRTETYIQRYLTMTFQKKFKKEKKNGMKSKLPSFSCCKTGCRPPLKTKTALTLDSSPPLLAFDHDMTSAQKGKKGWKRRPFNVCNCRSIARSYCHPPVLPFCHTLFMGPPSRMWRKSNHWLTCAASKTFKKSKNLRYQSWKKNLLQMNTEYKKK